MSAILLKGGLVLTFKNNDPTPHAFKADVLIKGDTIVEVAPDLTAPHGSCEIVDCTGKWVTPGQIDTHRHVWMSIMRGQQADWLLTEYLVKMTATQSPHVTASEASIGTLAGCLEAIHHGVTCVVDHAHCINTPEHAPAMIAATIKSGIRSKFCYGRAAPIPAGFQFTPEHAEKYRSWQVKQITELAEQGVQSGLGAGRLSDRVDLGLAYDALSQADPKNLGEHQEIIKLARKHGLSPITTHYVGGPVTKYSHNVKIWADAGLLDKDVLFSHANGLTHKDAVEEEWDLLLKTGASIGATPEDELGMAHGNPVAYEAVKRGVRVGLGCDCVSIQSADLFTQMRVALQWQRGHDHAILASSSGTAPLYHKYSSASAFRLATLGGAEALHLEHKLGTIEPGKLADIVVISVDDSINLAGTIDPFQGYVFWTKGEDVTDVMINGEWVKRDGALTKVKWGDVVGDLRKAIKGVEDRRASPAEEKMIYEATCKQMGCAVQ
ncbi:Metallo-dependent hydrolase [Rhodocollybia butyracea]|uniref:Metallo-dependent hydrolase n=1 Tax=Rhodocollybia butyracea TaxID=206335 RepID=A0A9P5PLL4_9AGAR|nr:Metallo-dependent hydrolase [Rhodocollybia butyracea]